MNQQPPKYDSRGHPRSDPRFSDQLMSSGEALQLRDETREAVMRWRESTISAAGRNHPMSVTSFLSGYLPEDDPMQLVDHPSALLDTLELIAEAGLLEAKLPEQPWSGDYWATYKGSLGARYSDDDFPGASDWSENKGYIDEHPAQDILASGDAEAINRLSPSEKYEALIGDERNLLTKAMWREGEYYFDTHGEVETWFGICHGWAPAAFAVKRPKQSIIVPAMTGDSSITFYPDDLKALISLLWAKAAPRTKFIGGRCDDKEPKMEEESGRIIDSQCFDTNPGTWHLAVVNQIGKSQRSAIIDAAFDYEVWNQPLVSYKYTYFHPQRAEHVETLEEAKMPIGEFTSDKFASHRDARTTHVVGVAMDVSYMIETRAWTQSTNGPEDDAVRTVRYMYDLELDENGVIIGGEWYNNRHPDFIWTPVKDRMATTYYDFAAVGDWTGENARVPEGWREPGQAAGRQGQPLAKVVNRLIELAQ